jgi:capsular polysaccharide biosynthesis protein
MRSALESLLGDAFEIVELKRMNAVRCKKVLLAQGSFFANELISGVPPIGHYAPHNINILRELLLTKRTLNSPPSGDFSRIFIYRKSLWRRLVNIDEISDIARKLNYRVMCPEEYSFDEQLAIFNSASVVVGPTGAWMANLLFMNRDKQVKVLYPDTMRNSSFWSGFASILNLKLENFYFTTDLPQNPAIKGFQPMHSDFYVPPDCFVKVLETLP